MITPGPLGVGLKWQGCKSSPGETNVQASLTAARVSRGHLQLVKIFKGGGTHCLVAWCHVGSLDLGIVGTEMLVFLREWKSPRFQT